MKIHFGLVILLLAALTGCAGFESGGYYGGAVVVQEPDQFLFGGNYDRGRDVHNYSHRGTESRRAISGGSHGAPHPGASHGAAPSSNGGRR